MTVSKTSSIFTHKTCLHWLPSIHWDDRNKNVLISYVGFIMDLSYDLLSSRDKFFFKFDFETWPGYVSLRTLFEIQGVC